MESNSSDTQPWSKQSRAFFENYAEATSACLLAMVQGDLFSLTLSHWWIASHTGLAASFLTGVVIFFAKFSHPWSLPVTLALVTGTVDYWVHPGLFGPFFLEALMTGVFAGLLSLGIRRAYVFATKRPAFTPHDER